MTDQGDGIDDELSSAARVAITVATQMADRLARAREEAARSAQGRSENEVKQLQERFSAERDAAVAKVSVVDRPEFWERSTLKEQASMHETAQQWKDVDPRAQAASETIGRELHERYGIDVSNPHATPDAVRAALTLREARDAAAATAAPAAADLPSGDVASSTQAEPAPSLESRIATQEQRLHEIWEGASFKESQFAHEQRAAASRPIRDTLRELYAERDQAAASGAERSGRGEAAVETALAGAALDEAARLDARAASERNDGQAIAAEPNADVDTSRTDRAAELELQAREYDSQADAGGTPDRTSDELRELAEDARAQAQLHREPAEVGAAQSAPQQDGPADHQSPHCGGALDGGRRHAQPRGVPERSADSQSATAVSRTVPHPSTREL
ncbi:hypothetical protein [Clavibacter nebraskensis]|uniref:hypothetical protein n=1 Tax=Clavibacter nebraskensis TaxID=31963 RepID=UPI003F8487FF